MAKQRAFAMFKPDKGKEDELKEIPKEDLPVLKEHGLISDKEIFTIKAKDGTISEIFESLSGEAKAVAHEDPSFSSYGPHDRHKHFPRNERFG